VTTVESEKRRLELVLGSERRMGDAEDDRKDDDESMGVKLVEV